ncbi:MAG TPA: hypothetical protein VK183_01610 [Flavobacterium sp.]|nr:hypothetical protein [Flavobacterium sp.]
MRKNSLANEILRRKRTAKRIKRRRLGKIFDQSKFRKTFQSIIQKYEIRRVQEYKSTLFEFLKTKKFIIGHEDRSLRIYIGDEFNLETNYNETIEKISDIVYSIWINVGKTIVVDFTNCTKVDQSALFLLQILRLEIQGEWNRLDRFLTEISISTKVEFVPSKISDVNLHLLLCGMSNNVEVSEGIVPIDSLGFLKGEKTRNYFLENRKGINATKIVAYVNKCLRRNDFEFSEIGESDLTNLIGEVLNNAEDHSHFSTYYVTANYHHEADATLDSGVVGELNISFMNFGSSIYEGLEGTKEENSAIYEIISKIYDKVSGQSTFSKDNLFTLYALQDGISRLKYEDESRGTGTMKFINCFFSLGDYVNEAKNKQPRLTILSGKTYLICDNKYKPFEKDSRYFVSLNDQSDLFFPPNKSHLKDLKYAFPGTMLSIKVFLNKEQLNEKIIKNVTS